MFVHFSHTQLAIIKDCVVTKKEALIEDIEHKTKNGETSHFSPEIMQLLMKGIEDYNMIIGYIDIKIDEQGE